MTKLSRSSDYAFAVRREFKNRGGEMTNYKYVELFLANVHERHRRIALELVTDLDPDDDNAIIIPDIIRRTNERASLHDRIIRANPENRRRRLALPVQGRGGGRNGGRTGGEEAATPNVSTRGDTTDAAKMQTVQLHTLTTLRCVMRLAARVTTQHVGAATPTQPRRSRLEARSGSSATTTVAIAAHANNIARVGEAFPTMNAPPPTGEMYQTGPYRRTFAITLATNEPNCSKYIVDNASPYTLTGSLNHLYDVQQLEKPKEIGGIKKDSTIKCTHVGKIDFTTHEGTLTVSNAYYGFYFGQIDVETAYLYALLTLGCTHLPERRTKFGFWSMWMTSSSHPRMSETKDIFAGHLRKKYRITEPAQPTWALGMKVSFAADGIILTQDLYVSKILERFGFTSAAKSATTPLAHGTTLTRADEEDAEARHLAQQFVGAILYAASSPGRTVIDRTSDVTRHV
ncbi:hypothetical protein RI054_24g104010 [Pseudoscourfieldia marina]